MVTSAVLPISWALRPSAMMMTMMSGLTDAYLNVIIPAQDLFHRTTGIPVDPWLFPLVTLCLMDSIFSPHLPHRPPQLSLASLWIHLHLRLQLLPRLPQMDLPRLANASIHLFSFLMMMMKTRTENTNLSLLRPGKPMRYFFTPSITFLSLKCFLPFRQSFRPVNKSTGLVYLGTTNRLLPSVLPANQLPKQDLYQGLFHDLVVKDLRYSNFTFFTHLNRLIHTILRSLTLILGHQVLGLAYQPQPPLLQISRLSAISCMPLLSFEQLPPMSHPSILRVAVLP